MEDDKQGRFENIGRKLDHATTKAEDELRRVIAFLNDKVVPEVRGHSSQALRNAAEQLHKLAEYMDKNKQP